MGEKELLKTMSDNQILEEINNRLAHVSEALQAARTREIGVELMLDRKVRDEDDTVEPMKIYMGRKDFMNVLHAMGLQP